MEPIALAKTQRRLALSLPYTIRTSAAKRHRERGGRKVRERSFPRRVDRADDRGETEGSEWPRLALLQRRYTHLQTLHGIRRSEAGRPTQPRQQQTPAHSARRCAPTLGDERYNRGRPRVGAAARPRGWTSVAASGSSSNETQNQLPRALCAWRAAYAHDGRHPTRKSQACSRSAASPG